MERTLAGLGDSLYGSAGTGRIGPLAAPFYGTVLRRAVFPRVYGASWEYHSHYLKFIYERLRGRRILELGVGAGDTARILPADNAYSGVDPSIPLLSVAARKFKQAGFPEPRFYQGVPDDLVLRSESFDYILCNLTPARLANPMAAMGEAARVLADGGEMIGCTPVPERNRAGSKIPGNLRSEESLGILLENSGFSFEPLEFENGSLLYFLAKRRPRATA